MAGNSGTGKGTAKGSKSAGGANFASFTEGLIIDDSREFAEVDQRDIGKWENAAFKLSTEKGMPPDKIRKIDDASAYASSIAQYAEDRPKNFVSVSDSKYRLQAAAYVESRKNHLELILVATAPWNIANKKGDKRVVKGAGTLVVIGAIKQSVKRGFGGTLKAEATPDSYSFYEKLGFKKTGVDEYTLSAKQAQKLLKMYDGR